MPWALGAAGVLVRDAGGHHVVDLVFARRFDRDRLVDVAVAGEALEDANDDRLGVGVEVAPRASAWSA